MTTKRFYAVCGALSLSLSLLLGCASPAAIPTTTVNEPTTPEALADAPATQPSAQPAAPAAVAPTTLEGKVIFKGQPVVGYAVTVYDARTNLPVERKADLSGVSGLAVLDQNLITDEKGGFKLQVVGHAPGQALRVVASKGKTSLEAIVSSELQTLGAKQRRVLATDAPLTLSELTTAMAKVARSVVLTTQMLTPEAAAPVLAKLMASLEAFSAKLDKQLKQMPAMADELTQAENPAAIGKAEAGALNVLINNAGLLQEITKLIAELIAEIAKLSQVPANRSMPASAPKLVEALSKVVYVGTVLTGALDGANGTFSLINSITGVKVDPSTGIGTIANRVTPNHHDEKPVVIEEVVPEGTTVTNQQELIAALEDTSVSTIVLANDIALNADSNIDVNISRPVTIHGGHGKFSISTPWYSYKTLKLGNAVTLRYLTLACRVSVENGDATTGATFKKVTFANIASQSSVGSLYVASGNKATCVDCTFSSQNAVGIAAVGAINVSDCRFLNCDIGISILPDATYAPVITDCEFTTGLGIEHINPIGKDLTFFANIKRNTINKAFSYNAPSFGILFSAAVGDKNGISAFLAAHNTFDDDFDTEEKVVWYGSL